MKVFSFLATDLYHVVWKCMTIFSSYSFSLDIASCTDYLIKHSLTYCNSWFGCRNVSADIDKGMKTQRKPLNSFRNACICVFLCGSISVGINALCLCWVIGRFDLRLTFHLFICHPLRVLPLITLTHSSLNTYRKISSTVIKHESISPFLPSSSCLAEGSSVCLSHFLTLKASNSRNVIGQLSLLEYVL